MANKVFIQPFDSNTGKSYVGTSTLNVTSGAGVIKTFLPPATSGLNDFWEIGCGDSGNQIDISQFWFDVQTSGQSFHVSYVTK
jgi:hypothetical protein